MKRRIAQHLIVGAAVVVCLGFLTVGSARAQSGLEALLAEIDEARSQHQVELASLQLEQTRFQALLAEIDELKESRDAAGPMTGDDALRTALRSAREAARDLQRHSDQVQALAAAIIRAENELLSTIEDRIVSVEEELRRADAQQRDDYLGELVELSQLREAYLRPLPEVPEVELDEILLGLDEETTPEELLATVDELDDNERRLLQHLEEIEERIRALEVQMDLQATARGFQLETSLFEEGVSSGRRVDRSTAGSEAVRGEQDQDGSGDSSAGGSSGSSQDQTAVGDEIRYPEEAPPGEQDTSTSGSDGWIDGEPASDVPCGYDCESQEGFAGGDDPYAEPSSQHQNDGDQATAGLTDDTRDEPDPALDDGVGIDGLNDLTPEENVPSSPSLMGVGAADGDPVLLWLQEVEIDDSEGLGLRSRIERLRRQRTNTEETIEELRARRRDLLRRAQELEAAEGF